MESVDLRPLSLGELLDRTFRLYRNHFVLFVGIMAIPAAVWLPFNVLLLSFQGSFMSAAASNPGKPPFVPTPAEIIGLIAGMFGVLLLSALVYSVAVAAASCAVADVYLGRTATVRGSYGRIQGRFWRLIGVIINILLRMFGLMVAVIAVFFGGMAAIGLLVGASRANPIFAALLVLALFFAYVAGLIFCVYFWLRYAVAIPILMIENLGVLATIRRSVFLTRGRRGHIFLALLVAVIIAYAGLFILQMPFSLAMVISAARGHWSQWLAFAAAVSGSIGSALTGPISMIAIVLLYYDSRIRKEAFDLQFMLSSLDRPAPAAGTVSPA